MRRLSARLNIALILVGAFLFTFLNSAATSNITPPRGTLRVGSLTPYPSIHVQDELYARSLVFDDGTNQISLVTVDLVGFHRRVSLEARRLILEAFGIAPDNVVISDPHTHSSGSASCSTRYTNEQELDNYQRLLAHRIAAGLWRAQNLLRPVDNAEWLVGGASLAREA
jgi:hypothetical protein